MRSLSTDYMYIVLDMDGVLNSREWRISQGLAKYWPRGEYRDISNDMLLNLKRIIDKCQMPCRIVFTSQARIGMDETGHGEYIRKMLRGCNLEIFDVTPNINAKRADEICAWIHNNFDSIDECKFVIIDDEQIYDYSDHQVKTSYDTGLTDKCVQVAIDLMNHLI